MNALRQALEKAVNENIQFEVTHSRDFPLVKINNQWIKLHVPYEVIIDAVLKALPAEKQKDYIASGGTTLTEEGSQRFYRYGGHDFALNKVKRLLQDAKEDK